MLRNQPQHSAAYYLRRQQDFESNARTYPRCLPLAIHKAKGVYVTDVDGRRYLDCLAGAGTLALGHNHPVVLDAIRRHLADDCPLHTLDLTTPTKDQFVEELFASLPPRFATHARIQFCGPSGADAVEAALKLVKTATGRRSILAFHGGYHGQTHGTLSLMGNLGPKSPVAGLMPDVHFLPYPYAYRCPLGCKQCDVRHCADYVENILNDVESGIPPSAGMILEIVQGEGGCIPCPDDWLREIRRLTRAKNIPLIVDEIQTGWGRTGRLYALEHAGIVPDVLILSKALGGGLPLSVILYHRDLDLWLPGAHTGTFRGNQLAMAAGLATLRYLLENNLAAHAERMGQRLQAHLRALQKEHPFLGEVRGRGLMLGAEIIDPEQTDSLGRPLHDGERARRIQRACFERGLMIEVGGRQGSVLRFLPPLIVTAEEVDAIAALVTDACSAAAIPSEAQHV
jgi:diaminobutyrate-2-oxoglutarate transaminase